MSDQNEYSLTYEIDGGTATRRIKAGGMAEAFAVLFAEFEEPPNVIAAVALTPRDKPELAAMFETT